MILTNSTGELPIYITDEVKMETQTMKTMKRKLKLPIPMIRRQTIFTKRKKIILHLNVFRCVGEKIVDEVRCGHDNPPCAGQGLYSTPGNIIP